MHSNKSIDQRLILTIEHNYSNLKNKFDSHRDKVSEISNREMKKFMNNNATETLREDNQELIKKINKQLGETHEVINNQSETIENLNREIEILKRKYETEKSLREELKENIKVLDEDNKSFRKKFEESEKKIHEHTNLENYSLKADEFVDYYKKECLKYKNELKEVKENYKNFEMQRKFSRDIGIC
jgi:chromosome segregation ATPase